MEIHLFADVVDDPNSCQRVQCGPNAECRESYGMVTCLCRPGTFGNPYVGCRPECVINSDCPTKQSCINNHCVDPCVGACGLHAQCQVVNHVPICYCKQDYTGDPFISCFPFKPGMFVVLLILLVFKTLNF